jgi:hypothetical protein
MAKDPAIYAHQEWLGYVQPIGLVVSIPALIDASAFLNRNYGPDHQRFLSALPQNADGEPIPEIPDFLRFSQDVLYWDPALIAGAPGSDPVPGDLEVNLENYNETLRPTYALRNLEGDNKWLLLICVHSIGTNLDEPYAPHDRGWQASPQARFERLLRQTGVQIGLLVNGREIRLVYAPEKELSGHITFKLSDMVQVAGRPIFAALQMLLGSERLYSVADKERLPAILANSRKYQNVVSTQLAEQVLEALYELLRGFQAANDQTKGELLRDVLARDPDHVYHGLLTTLLRLVFVLYAEDRGLLSTDPIYSNYYSVAGLYERLRADAGRYNDTMDQRYGAWAQLLSLFRLIYSGGSHGAMRIPAREGYLFDPDRYLFLEGRHDRKDKPVIPRVSDGVLYRVLSKLLLLDGERLSYRTLAVEQIGSVYEAIMGFELQVAAGKSIAIRPGKKHGAPATINLEELLRTSSDKRVKWFTETTDQKLTGQAAEGLKTATTLEDLLVVLDRKIAKTATPNVVPPGAMIFQPSNERRKSGSHYTPRSLTEPIVEAALEPVLKQLDENPTPEQILNLKVCDPAMGSGAFLVEACRQIGDALAKAWHAHNEVPPIPPDEDEALNAQRVIAQRCLYGVDKNPMAVDLAKLSLWLATLARNHPFTFLDHSLRHGDSLVGLTRQQIAAFHWQPAGQRSFFEERLREDIERVSQYRQRILAAREDRPYSQLRQELEGAEESLREAREIGDTVVMAFFSAEKPKDRENRRIELRGLTESALKDPTAESNDIIERSIAELRRGPKGVAPFHWELEFPEVFTSNEKRQHGDGFDVIVGNPPFIGGKRISTMLGDQYRDWLPVIHPESNSNSDLVAHFFRRAFGLLRQNGCFGLIATNTIGQGDTRATGLRWICKNGGNIYRARKRLKWPGEAAVVVSVIHIKKGDVTTPRDLDGQLVSLITAFLFHSGGHDDPLPLKSNEDQSYIGYFVMGMGFTFDDQDSKGIASPIREMGRLVASDPRNQERIFPYIGGEELNDGPSQECHRYVINFEDFPLARKEVGHSWFKLNESTQRKQLQNGLVAPDYPGPVAADWPDLLQIVRDRVKPERDKQKRKAVRERWWQYADKRPGLTQALKKVDKAIVTAITSRTFAFSFQPSNIIFAHYVAVIPTASMSLFAVLQSRVHEVWARFFGSTMKDDPCYFPSDCFETFPLPELYEESSALVQAGEEYYRSRQELMIASAGGLTRTYSRFDDPDEESTAIVRLRKLQDELDRAVLDAYDWHEIRPICEFIPEFEDDPDGNGSEGTRKRKYRYRWPDENREDVLARLLKLNRQRAFAEGQAVPDEIAITPAANAKKATKKGTKARTDDDTGTESLFARGAEEV